MQQYHDIDIPESWRPLRWHVAFIYILFDPRDGAVRYVGQTTMPEARFSCHYASLKNDTPKDQWVRELRSLGLRPRMEVLATCRLSEANATERAWIEWFAMRGDVLFNKFLPGGGVLRTKAVA